MGPVQSGEPAFFDDRAAASCYGGFQATPLNTIAFRGTVVDRGVRDGRMRVEDSAGEPQHQPVTVEWATLEIGEQYEGRDFPHPTIELWAPGFQGTIGQEWLIAAVRSSRPPMDGEVRACDSSLVGAPTSERWALRFAAADALRELDAARARWAAADITDYDVTIRGVGSTTRGLRADIEVRNGVTAEAIGAENWMLGGVDSLHDRVERYLRLIPAELAMSFDPINGSPTLIEFDLDLTTIDDEIGYRFDVRPVG